MKTWRTLGVTIKSDNFRKGRPCPAPPPEEHTCLSPSSPTNV